ncbi:hypothetical protein KCX83_02565 [Brucella oryzae]|uniref:hypothetical protein n=1 Tax=Brucella oryzae TaxID=335286 RepID=UPI001B830273|nr:hypothetical protein [Brucella oryzae]MBR7651204.1 hypothetical protein [Brucella oryzae]
MYLEIESEHAAQQKNSHKHILNFLKWGVLSAVAITVMSFLGAHAKLPLVLKPIFFTVVISSILYVGLTIAFSPVISAIIAFVLVLILRVASAKKMAATGEPLIIGDISHTTHISLALRA